MLAHISSRVRRMNGNMLGGQLRKGLSWMSWVPWPPVFPWLAGTHTFNLILAPAGCSTPKLYGNYLPTVRCVPTSWRPLCRAKVAERLFTSLAGLITPR